MHIPYGKDGIQYDVPKEAEVLLSHIGDLHSTKSEDELVIEAMQKPYGGVDLKELASKAKTAAIICSDHTRPVPSKHIIPFMLKDMREANPDIDIKLIIATGFHRPTTREELVNKFGEDIVNEETIIIHDAQDDASNVDIGVLPSGAHLVIDKAAVDADLIVSEGFIEPHFFAGFSGGRKSILPGICSRTTVLGNHCSAFIDDEHSRTGVLEGNPIHKDMVAAAEMAGLKYIVNTVIDLDKHVAAAFAGDPFEAHKEGCEFLSQYCKVKPEVKGDIVVTTNGGYPLDQNVYQSVKGLTAAEAAAKDDGVLIICSACNDGSGGDSFYEALKNCESAAALQESILKVAQDATEADQWEYQIMSRMLMNHKIIFVSVPEMKDMLEEMKLSYAPTLEAALEMAKAEKGEDAHTVFIPDGVSVIVEK